MLPLPAALWTKITAFLTDGRTGQIVLDVKDGQVLAYKLTEAGRCDGYAPVAVSERSC